MAQFDLNKRLQVVAVACIAIIFSVSVLTLYDSQRTLTVKDFPLEVDVNRSVFYVGENLTFTGSIINRSGRDLNIASNGQQPFVFIHHINDTISRVQTCPLVYTLLKSNDKMSQSHEVQFTEPGTYILEGSYSFMIDNALFENKIANITVEVR